MFALAYLKTKDTKNLKYIIFGELHLQNCFFDFSLFTNKSTKVYFI